MYFDSVDEQKSFFARQPHQTYTDVSFNGQRDFRLKANYLNLTFSGYNYCEFVFNGITQYFFIDNFVYVNDNVTALLTTLDTMQTFMFDIFNNVKDSVVNQLTLKTNDFKKYIPYTNKVSVEHYVTNELLDLSYSGINQRYRYGFIVVNFAKDNDTTLTARYIDNGIMQPFRTFLFPIGYDSDTSSFFNVSMHERTDNTIRVGTQDYFSLLEKSGSYILNSAVGIIFSEVGGITLTNDTSIRDLIIDIGVDKNGDKIGAIKNVSDIIDGYLYEAYTSIAFYKECFISKSKFSLNRQPYYSVVIGNSTNQIELNTLSFLNTTDIDTSNDLTLSMHCYTSLVFPFSTAFKFKLNGREIQDKLFLAIVEQGIIPPIRVTAWQDYVSRNTATINDGLATKHKYDNAIAENNRVTGWTANSLSVLGSDIEALGKVGAGDIFGGIAKGITSKLDFASRGVAIENTYTNAKLRMQQEKALQQIQWNDVKNSPSVQSNFNASLTTKNFIINQGIKVYEYTASNFNDIEKYHNMVGYGIHRVEKMPLKNLKRHINYDYISFDNLNFSIELPQVYITDIESLLLDGVRFWYNYDNFLNFENNEEL